VVEILVLTHTLKALLYPKSRSAMVSAFLKCCSGSLKLSALIVRRRDCALMFLVVELAVRVV
jgi:hypothetical protein